MSDNSHAAAAATLAVYVLGRTGGTGTQIGSVTRDAEYAKIFAVYRECLNAVRGAEKEVLP